MKDAVVFLAPDQSPEDLARRFTPLAPKMVQALMRGFIKDSLDVAARLTADVWFSVSETDSLTLALLPPDMRTIRKSHDDHGSRLMAVSDILLARGYRRVIVVPADCPTIDADYIEIAFGALAGNDAVIGPSSSGGYVLVGVAKSIPRLFLEIDMGTPQVLRQTLLRARELDLAMNVVPPRRGSDCLADVVAAIAAGEIGHAINTMAALSPQNMQNSDDE